MNKNWYAVYTKTQCEKKVAALLLRKKIENFCPLNRILNTQGNRRKMAYEPLFPSFVFVYINETEMRIVKQTNDVINFIYWLGQPAVIKATEIENISNFISSHYNIKLEKTAVISNGLVRISNEPQLDLNGGMLSLRTNKVRLALPSLGFAITAETEKAVTDTSDYGIVNSKMLM